MTALTARFSKPYWARPRWQRVSDRLDARDSSKPHPDAIRAPGLFAKLLQINTLRHSLHNMPTVALVSRKGGCGKSTLATNMAAHFARAGLPITLGDLDHQQSMRVWLKRRPSAAPAVVGWVGDVAGNVRPPLGVTHLVLDTPGGLHGLSLAKVAMVADAILIPVSGSVFDRESASDCWTELRAHPRVVSGRCQVATVGMRLDRRTQAEDVVRDWAASIGLNWLCSLRSSQVYVRAVENGLSIFDMPAGVTAVDREQWEPLLAWLASLGFATAAPVAAPVRPSATVSPLPGLNLPLPAPTEVHATVTPGLSPVPVPRPAPRYPAPAAAANAAAAPAHGLARFVPRFLRSKSSQTG